MTENLLKKISKYLIITFLLAFVNNDTYAQKNIPTFKISTAGLKNNETFIENVGQYGNTVSGYENMDTVLFGYEGFGMPILFTSKGLIHLQRKIEKISKEEEEKLERQGVQEEEIELKKNITDRTITMEWLGANSDVEIIKKNKSSSYFTYGMLIKKAYGYEEIIYKNLYNGIDVIYNFKGTNGENLKYAIILKPGADISQIKLKYSGDVRSIEKNREADIIINSSINGIKETAPVSFYTASKEKINFVYSIDNNIVTFKAETPIDNTKEITIDPFISTTTNLSGTNIGKAKDIDFDYAGNVYITGGGSGNTCQLAKYNSNGVLQWTFNGSISTPSWVYGQNYGGAIVEKSSGDIYVGQGITFSGFRVIKLTTAGVYDNFITIANPNFRENWKMYWNCNNGVPEILIAGGGVTSNINLGKFSPPSPNVTSLNITGLSSIGQDIVDFTFDPETNSLYSLFVSNGGDPAINNRIFKNNTPYGSATLAWNVLTGFNSFFEYNNRPYLVDNDNSANVLSLNPSYLYYWDGANLKAFNKTNGASVGTTLTITNSPRMQGGIFADGCNNVFVGSTNGTIKVYNFNGTVFNDTPPDITLTGFTTKSVYDIVYDEPRKLLYVCGDGFVASVNVSAYCSNSNTFFSLNLLPNCNSLSVAASLTPAVPVGSTVTFTLYNGTTQIASNTTGNFNGLASGINYNIIATVNATCSGTQISASFQLPSPSVTTTVVNETCSSNNGQITAVGSGSTAPYTYSINGINFISSGIFSSLAAGTYNITVKDANGCTKTVSVIVLGTNGSSYTFTIASTNTSCGNNNGSITIATSGGIPAFQFSIDNGANYQLSNTFPNLAGAAYQIRVKDASGCVSGSNVVNIIGSTRPTVVAIALGSSCGPPQGTITATGSGGSLPYSFSIDGGLTYQTTNVFNNVIGGSYTVTIKDVNNCTNTSALLQITNIPSPDVVATSTKATCSLANGSITATGLAGQAPYSFSINGGVTYQTGNTFNNLLAGNYNIMVKDANGCTKSSTTISVVDAAGPSVSLLGTNASCGIDNGKIKVTTTGGTAGFQYSLNNGLNYQRIPTFNNLPAGNYDVLVKDANNCTTMASVTIGRNPITRSYVFAGRDTVIVINDPLQLNALDINSVGFTDYLWSPAYGLSKDNIKNPIAILDKDTTYEVLATTADGCTARDTISIKVILYSEIFVPNAFSPNNDGINDVLKPKLVGIKALKYFSIYNRYGELIFTTSAKNVGWNGLIKGTPQNTNTFVWMIEAVDYKGAIIYKKGTTILIR